MTLIRLTDHGALSDAQMVEDGAMTSGLPLLTSASGLFTLDDVGKAIIVGGAGAAGAKLRTMVAAYVSATELTLTANAATTVADTGVAWGTDCSAALQAALDEADSMRGGSILVDGYFLLTEPVGRSFFATVTTSHVRILGSGTDSAIVVAVDSTEDAITLNTLTVDIERISFVGIPDAGADARRVLAFNACTVSLRRCQLLGLATGDQPVYFSNSWATLEGNMFGGTFVLANSMPSGVSRAVVYAVDWYGFEDHSSLFIDYGYWRGLLLTKSGEAATSAWVGLDTPNDSYLTSASRVAGIATFRDTRMDEGSLKGIWAEPASGTIGSVELVGTGHNVSPATGASGIYASSVDNVLVDRCAFGWSTNDGTTFGIFEDCERVTLDSLTLLQGVNRVEATDVDALIVRDTEIAQYGLTRTGFYPQRSADGGLALIKAGAISDADFPAAPGRGATAFDRTNGRFYLRARGDWVYFAMAGGSLLGPELVTNGSGSTTAGWTPNNSTLSSVGGNLRVTLTGAYGRALTTFQAEIGTTYVFSIVVVGGAAVVRLGRTVSGAEYVSASASTTVTFTPVATTTVHISLIVNSETVGHYAEFRSISVRAA